MPISHPSKLSLLLDYVFTRSCWLHGIIILMFSFSVSNDEGILLHSWSPIKLLVLIFFISPTLLLFLCYLKKSRNGITLVRRINFAFILFWVSGSEYGHSQMTRDSYCYDHRGNGSCGNFHTKKTMLNIATGLWIKM